MTRGWISVALACAFGAFVGTLTALEISARFEYGSYLWGIGALVGGIAAYVAIDFRHFCSGVALSYRRTIAWRPYGLYWRAFGSAFVASAVIISTIVTPCIITLGIMMSFDWMVPDYTLTGGHIISFSIITLSFVGILMGPVQISLDGEGPEKQAEQLHKMIRMNWNLARTLNVISIVIVGVRGALHGLRYSVIHAPGAVTATRSAIKKIGKTITMFVAGVFVFVHSQRRTICLVDATIVTVIGYSFGSAIIGAIAGVLLGVINFEVVSVRLLRLVPASR